MNALNNITWDDDVLPMVQKHRLIEDVEKMIAYIAELYPHAHSVHVSVGYSPECCCDVDTCRCWCIEIDAQIPAEDTAGQTFEACMHRQFELLEARGLLRSRVTFLPLYEGEWVEAAS